MELVRLDALATVQRDALNIGGQPRVASDELCLVNYNCGACHVRRVDVEDAGCGSCINRTLALVCTRSRNGHARLAIRYIRVTRRKRYDIVYSLRRLRNHLSIIRRFARHINLGSWFYGTTRIRKSILDSVGILRQNICITKINCQFVRNRDLVLDVGDGDLEPLLAREGLLGGYNPLAVSLLHGEEVVVADLGVGDLAGETNGLEDRGERNLGVAAEDVLQVAVGELHGVVREALGFDLHDVGAVDGGFGGVQRLDLVCVLVVVVEHLSLKIVASGLGGGETDVDRFAIGGLELVAVLVEDADVEAVTLGDVLVLGGGILYGLGLGLVELDTLDVERGALGEGALVGVGVNNNAVFLQRHAGMEGGHLGLGGLVFGFLFFLLIVGCVGIGLLGLGLLGIAIDLGLGLGLGLVGLVLCFGVIRLRLCLRSFGLGAVRRGLLILGLLLLGGLSIGGTLLLGGRLVLLDFLLRGEQFLRIHERLRRERRRRHKEREQERENASRCAL